MVQIHTDNHRGRDRGFRPPRGGSSGYNAHCSLRTIQLRSHQLNLDQLWLGDGYEKKETKTNKTAILYIYL